MKEKMITVKIPERNLEWIKKNYPKAKGGVKSLFADGGIDIMDAHAMSDLLMHLNDAFKIEEE